MRQWDIVTLANGSHALIMQADLLDYARYRVAAPLFRQSRSEPSQNSIFGSASPVVTTSSSPTRWRPSTSRQSALSSAL